MKKARMSWVSSTEERGEGGRVGRGGRLGGERKEGRRMFGTREGRVRQ